jgi:hypothetical protein
VNYRGTGWNRFFDSQEESRAPPATFSVNCSQQAIPLIEAVWSQCFRVPGGWSASRSATCKVAENDCLERRNSIRPRISSRVAYKAERGGNELFWSLWKMYPRSPERHRNREATVYVPA